ncbi:hypothetical protein Slala04_21700 [Streptomyces lavendulae subsp. lavendulae]|nr:hypothetical protein Slala04_21700 [Streptomyces lavendulae subsp. lavendulae]
MAAYAQPKGLAGAILQERVAIGRAPSSARAGQSPVPEKEHPARSFGGFPAVLVFPWRDGRSRVERSDIA